MTETTSMGVFAKTYTTNGTTEVPGYGTVRVTDATASRAKFQRRLDEDTEETKETNNYVAWLTAELADQRAALSALEKNCESLKRTIASLDIALGEPTARGTIKRSARRSQSPTEANEGTS